MSNTSLLGAYGALGNSSLLFRNKVINGDMRIDQRNEGTKSNLVTTQYHVDRWNYLGTTASKFTIQKSAVAPSGFTSSLLLTSSSAYAISATADWLALRHHIEGFNVADLAWGTADAQTVTLSFWTRSSLTGTFGGSILNDGANRSYPFTYSISAANTWEYKTVVIPGDTSGTWTTDNSSGMRIVFSLGAGTSQKSAAGTWVGSAVWGGATGTVDLCATNGATLYITGVQLEAGPVATPFEHRPIGLELQLCQRYYQQYGYKSNFGGGFYNTPNSPYIPIRFSVAMRIPPSLLFSQLSDFDLEPFDVPPTSMSIDSAATTEFSTSISVTDSTARTTGFACTLFIDTVGGYIAFNAEL